MTRTKQNLMVFGAVVTFLFGTAGTALSADGAANLTRVRMGLAARSTTSMPFFVAKERGFFREEGLEVELDRDAGDPNDSGDDGEQHAIRIRNRIGR